MNDKTIEKTILSIQNEVDEKIRSLADSYREKVLLPYCKKNGVTFCSGNGYYFFHKNGNTVYYSLGDDARGFKPNKTILAGLNVMIDSWNDFAQYVPEVSKEDIGE